MHTQVFLIAVLEKHIADFACFTEPFNFKLVRGDRIVIERLPGRGVNFQFNGRHLGGTEAPQYSCRACRQMCQPLPAGTR